MLLVLVFIVIVFAVLYANANSAKNSLADEIYRLQDDLHGCEKQKEQAEEYSKELTDRLYACNNEKQELVKKLQKIDDYNERIFTLKTSIKELENELESLEIKSVLETTDISNYDNISSEECKNRLALLKTKYNEMSKENKIVQIVETGQPKKQVLNNQKQILLCFNAQCSNIIDNLTVKNVDTSRAKIQRAFDTINSIFSLDGLQLCSEALEIKLEELTLVYAFLVKKEQEREEQKAIKEQMLEEEKARKEIEREKLRIEKEEKQFRNEVSKLMKYMQKADDIEKQLYIDKIKELEDKIKVLEKDKENVLQREQNTRAGYVYVISNIGSFGEDVYKIGMTRRLEPLDRVKELGDASVPFEFDVHAMIFSEDAPALEAILHQTFKKYQVNKVNDRKEFFKVSLDKIEKVVKEHHNATVTFTKVAEAEQYRESLRLSEAAAG